ncbi:hypothetical protein [Methylocucumis oryzae]|uniref:hypothetical protein n=1 Tax=Methylocucumis oryzae TaxID=1632867 RepID=UPI00103C23D0|nr:hypothetical protein [Methylocucumis oryzae]
MLSLRETSETQSKPSYFRGQCWGALGVLVGSLNACFCLPLTLQIHLGFQHLGEQTPTLTLSERLVTMALEFARTYERSSWLILDAFFASELVFRLARSVWSVTLKQPYLHIITRAKKKLCGLLPAHDCGTEATWATRQIRYQGGVVGGL